MAKRENEGYDIFLPVNTNITIIDINTHKARDNTNTVFAESIKRKYNNVFGESNKRRRKDVVGVFNN